MVSPTPPVINALPAAPTRGDAPADYSSKADTFTAALPPFGVQINAAMTWQADSMAASLGYKNAAAASATAAAGSAEAAAGSISAAAHQVDLATTQAGNAAASANSAQIYAAAAGSAAGTPSFTGHDAFDVLQINSGKTGVQWGKAGQSVGDILVTARNPGATYAQTNRVSYLQSAYPDLYALLGAIPDTDRSAVSSGKISTSFATDSIVDMATNSGGLTIAICENVPFCYTSTDSGSTWTRRATPFNNGYRIACLNGVFVATVFTSNNNISYRTSDGATWTTFNLPIIVSAATVGVVAGLFVTVSAGINGFCTSPDGATWTERTSSAGPFPTSNMISVNGALVVLSGTTNYVHTSNGLTWSYIQPTIIGSTNLAIATITYKAGVYYATTANADGLLFTCAVIGPTNQPWTRIAGVFVYPDGSNAIFNYAGASINNECIIFTTNTTRAWISNDLGLTWSWRIIPATFNKPFVFSDKFIFIRNGNTDMHALPFYSYDKTTSFITPKVSAQPAPLTTYIKGKLA